MKPYRGGFATAAQSQEALLRAERQLVRPSKEQERKVFLRPSELETLPALFQPREIALGRRATNKRHVERLQRRMKIEPELDPITVIKLRNRWVVVDGHHRLDAYQKERREGTIECEWFDGTVREAMDTAARDNAKLRLEMSKEDRYEMAWKRVLIGGWTTQEIRNATKVGKSMLTHMRRVLDRYKNKREHRDTAAKEMRRAVDAVGGIMKCGWTQANLAFNNVTPKQRTKEEKAQTLKRLLRERLTTKLSEDPEVTALALLYYDEELPRQLISTWGQRWREDEEDEKRERSPCADDLEQR
jgi:hypothetical protein